MSTALSKMASPTTVHVCMYRANAWTRMGADGERMITGRSFEAELLLAIIR